MVDIFDFFETLLEEHPIQAVGIEKLFFNANQNNAEFVYGVRGALCMLFRRHTIPIYEWTPQQIKKHITGNGSASKELMLAVISKIFTLTSEELKRHDAADGLGIALMVKQKREKAK
jgi:crossover junction endodeoxyribonuclease RuvC